MNSAVPPPPVIHADKVEIWALEDLHPNPRNARVHSPEQIDQVCKSMLEFGWTIPVLARRDGMIIAGHCRWMAAAKIGWSEAPVIVAKGWSDAQVKAYTLADNQLSLNATWDHDLLRLELGDLQGGGFDLNILGFAQIDVDKLFADAAGGENMLSVTLADRFGVPPFSTFNAREGWWQDRKRAWLALGIQSELGRGAMIDQGGDAKTFNSNDRMRALQQTGDSRTEAHHTSGGRVSPGGSPRPAADYSPKRRGSGKRGSGNEREML